MNPVHTAAISNAAALYALIFSRTMQAVEGAILSGVAVATMMRSMANGDRRASAKASIAALDARSLVNSSTFAIRLSLIPKFSYTHSGVVGTCSDRYSLVSTFEGTYPPVPKILTLRITCPIQSSYHCSTHESHYISSSHPH